MKKGLLGVIIILSMIFCAAMASASPLSIILKAPSDGTKTTAYTQEFIYSFDEYPNVLNCSVYIDGEFKKMMNAIFKIEDNKISTTVEPGTHEWLIKCFDDQFTEIVSDNRTFTLAGEQDIKEGYTKISNNDNSVTYVLTIASGQSPAPLPAAKGGDNIKIVLKGKTYYIDIVKMGSSTNGSFVGVRDRSTSKPYTIYALSAQAFDFDKDGVTDINLLLDKVERNRNAFFTVIPYPDEAPAQETTPAPAPEEPAEELVEEETPVEEPAGSGAPQQPGTEPGVPEKKPAEPAAQPESQTETDGGSLLPLILVIAIVLVIIIIAIVLVKKKKSPKPGVSEKKQEPAKADEKPGIITSTGKKAK